MIEFEFQHVSAMILVMRWSLQPQYHGMDFIIRIMNVLFSSFKGILDDLEFLLEEDLLSINLCALQCELRNTEQLLSSLGLFSYEVGSRDECNA